MDCLNFKHFQGWVCFINYTTSDPLRMGLIMVLMDMGLKGSRKYMCEN
jgi:hypothetical protein